WTTWKKPWPGASTMKKSPDMRLNLIEGRLARQRAAAAEPSREAQQDAARLRLAELDAAIAALPADVWKPFLDLTPPLHPWSEDNGWEWWVIVRTCEAHGWIPHGDSGWHFAWWRREALAALICPLAQFSALPADVQETLIARARAEVAEMHARPELFNQPDAFSHYMKGVSLAFLLAVALEPTLSAPRGATQSGSPLASRPGLPRRGPTGRGR